MRNRQAETVYFVKQFYHVCTCVLKDIWAIADRGSACDRNVYNYPTCGCKAARG